jgi:hypothetical protein
VGRHLKDFEHELVHDLVELRMLYLRNAQSFGGLCSLMPEGVSLVTDYLLWLSTEISSFLDMFGGVNENFVTATV